jgi:hypothetical protein
MLGRDIESGGDRDVTHTQSVPQQPPVKFEERGADDLRLSEPFVSSIVEAHFDARVCRVIGSPPGIPRP